MESLFQIYALIFGLLIGSFLNVVILRLPANRNLTFERSACPHCGTQLMWYHNVPLISYLFLRGECSFCHNHISWRYPLIEILTGLVSYWLFPPDLSGESISLYFFFFTVACIFICHFFIDLDHQILPDKLNIYLLLLFLPFAAFNFHWTHWLLGGIFGFGVPLFVTWLFYKLRGQVGLGGGDIKLFGILGLLLGPMGIFFTIFLSCLVGASVGIFMIATKKITKEKTLPFGPSILIVASFQIFFPQYAYRIQSWFF